MLDDTRPTAADTTPGPVPETDEQARDRVNAMTAMGFRVYVDRLRRMALRQGLALHKSRTRDPKALTYKGYTLVDIRSKKVVLGRRPDGYLPEVFEVERFLNR